MTFNDLIMALLSQTARRVVNEFPKTCNYDDMIAFASVLSFRRKPKNSDDLVLDNQVAPVFFKMKLIKDLNEEKEIIQETMKQCMKNLFRH